ncbi:MAG: DUF3800 domain-containing protein [Planctomycetota bacterium]
MAFLLFIDESGQDKGESPYEVLAGAAVEDRDLWNLIQAIQQAELDLFGRRYSGDGRELKGKKILKRKVFRHAEQLPAILPARRVVLARESLEDPVHPTKERLAALAQTKIEYVGRVLDLCGRFRVKVFASIVRRGAEPPAAGEHLRKDYAYLFERFFYFLEDMGGHDSGIVVFDELEKSRSHILLDQMANYFLRTTKGRQRAGQIIPEPFFVHSDLTTGVQIADLVAYILSWNFRLPTMTEPKREELSRFAQQIMGLRHRAIRDVSDNPEFVVWSLAYIDDLRPKSDKEPT